MSLEAARLSSDEDPRKWEIADQLANGVGSQFLHGHQVVRSGRQIELRGADHHGAGL